MGRGRGTHLVPGPASHPRRLGMSFAGDPVLAQAAAVGGPLAFASPSTSPCILKSRATAFAAATAAITSLSSSASVHSLLLHPSCNSLLAMTTLPPRTLTQL